MFQFCLLLYNNYVLRNIYVLRENTIFSNKFLTQDYGVIEYFI